MSRRARRNHTPAFKSKVALAAVKGDRTLAQLAEQFDVHQRSAAEQCDKFAPFQLLASLWVTAGLELGRILHRERHVRTCPVQDFRPADAAMGRGCGPS